MKRLKKNWKLIIPLCLVLLVISFLTIVAIQRQRSPTSPQPNDISPTQQKNEEFVLPDYTQPPLTPEGEVDTGSGEVKKAIQLKNQLEPKLPIYVESFQTSVDIATTINIYAITQDPDYLIHIDIYGVDYQNQDTDESANPDVTAFKESFLQAKKLLEQNGVNIKDIYFVFGGRQYIQETAELWIKTFDLMNSSH